MENISLKEIRMRATRATKITPVFSSREDPSVVEILMGFIACGSCSIVIRGCSGEGGGRRGARCPFRNVGSSASIHICKINSRSKPPDLDFGEYLVEESRMLLMSEIGSQ